MQDPRRYFSSQSDHQQPVAASHGAEASTSSRKDFADFLHAEAPIIDKNGAHEVRNAASMAARSNISLNQQHHRLLPRHFPQVDDWRAAHLRCLRPGPCAEPADSSHISIPSSPPESDVCARRLCTA